MIGIGETAFYIFQSHYTGVDLQLTFAVFIAHNVRKILISPCFDLLRNTWL